MTERNEYKVPEGSPAEVAWDQAALQNEALFGTVEDARLTLAEMQAEVREVNEMNGWFDSERPFSADIALLHTEVTELFEAMLKGDAENAGEEFADIFIRLLDTAERYGHDLSGEVSIPHGAEELFAPGVSYLHLWIDRAYEVYRKHGDVRHARIRNELKCLLSLVMTSAALMDVDLIAEYQKKIARNRERGYRHGGKHE